MGEVGLLDRGIQGASITDPLTWNRKLDGLGNLGRARPSLHRFDGLQCKDMADLACCPDVCAVHRDLLLYGICYSVWVPFGSYQLRQGSSQVRFVLR